MAIGVSSPTGPAAEAAARPASILGRWPLRGYLWMALLSLTLAVLVYPIDLQLQYSAIQSVDTISNPTRFAVVYYGWLAALLATLFAVPNDRRHGWEHAGIACVFAVVFLGFFMAHEPLPGLRAESTKLVALAQLVTQFDELPVGVITDASDPRLESVRGQGVAEFPGLGLVVAAVASVTGLSPTQAVVALFAIYLLAFPALLYLLFATWLRSQRLAVLGTLLYFQGNLVVADGSPGLHGQFFGTLWLAGFLYLANRKGQLVLDSVGDRVVALVLLGATTTIHFLSAVLFPFALGGSTLVRLIRQGSPRSAGEASSILLYLTLPVAWLTYWAVITFDQAVTPVGDFIDNALSGRTLSSIALSARANAGGAVPAWAASVRLLWAGLLLVPGALVGIWYVWPWRPRHSSQDLVGQGLGVGSFELASGTVSQVGAYLVRIIMHVPFFTVPLMLSWIERRKAGARAVLVGTLVAVFAASSLPTFFSHHPSVSTGAVYPFEEAAGRFLEREFNDGEDIRLYTSVVQLASLRLWAPLKSFVFEGTPENTKDAEEYWSTWDLVMRRYHDPPLQTPVFAWSSVRMTALAQHLYNVPDDDGHWSSINGYLERTSDRFYDSGQLQMYTQEGGIDEPFTFDGKPSVAAP